MPGVIHAVAGQVGGSGHIPLQFTTSDDWRGNQPSRCRRWGCVGRVMGVQADTDNVHLRTVIGDDADKQVAQARSSAPRRASSASSPRSSSAKPTIKARQAPSGFYYKVRVGDTIKKLSSKYDISSAKICRANRLPLSATLLSGQQIYIPKG